METERMLERSPLGTGPRRSTPLAQPSAARRACLVTELAETPIEAAEAPGTTVRTAAAPG